MKQTAPLMKHFSLASLFLSILCVPFASLPVRAETCGPIKATAIPIYQSYSDSTTSGYTAGLMRLENTDKVNSHRVLIGSPMSSSMSSDIVLTSNYRQLEIPAGQTADVWLYRPAINCYTHEILIEVDGSSYRLQNSIWAGDHVSPSQQYYHRYSSYGSQIPVAMLFSQNASKYRDAIGEIVNLIGNRRGVPVRSALPSKSWPASWVPYSQFELIVMTDTDYDGLTPEGSAAISDYIASGGFLWIVPTSGELGDDRVSSRMRSSSLPIPDKYRKLDEITGFGKFIYANPPTSRTEDEIQRGIQHDGAQIAFNIDSAHMDILRQVSSYADSRNACQTPIRANSDMPVVEKTTVPIRTILVLLIGYAVLIGPALQFFLMKKHRRIWMLWIVPAASIGICVTVLIWSLFSEGIYGHMRMQLVTLLDQPAGRATTFGWAGYYSPLTDSDGLRFSSDTILQPQLSYEYRRGSESRSLGIDWSSGQHLTSGWLLSRTPIHFRLQKVEHRREKLIFRRNKSGDMEITNALGVDVVRLYVCGDDGKCYQFDRIGAGDTVVLNTAGGVELIPREDMLLDYYRSNSHQVPDADSYLRSYQSLLKPWMYVAKVEGHPFVDAGMTNPSTDRSETVVVGRFEEEK